MKTQRIKPQRGQRERQRIKTPAQRHRLFFHDLVFVTPPYFRSPRPRWYLSKSLLRDPRAQIGEKISSHITHRRYLGRVQEVAYYGQFEAMSRYLTRLQMAGKHAEVLALLEREKDETGFLA
jgi:hypothetical protein